MKYTTKDKQDPILRATLERFLSDFADKLPSRTIGEHHYIRRRHLEQFMYDFADYLLKPCHCEGPNQGCTNCKTLIQLHPQDLNFL